jgi:transcriptional regulator with XRE-family HTH domain
VNQAALVEDNSNEGPGGAEYARAVGARLRAVRKQQWLSLQAVEVGSDHEFKASVLGAYERGERAISLPRLRRLAALYDVTVDHFLPPDEDADGLEAEDSAVDRRGEPIRSQSGGVQDKITIDLSKLTSVTGPEGKVLRRFLSTIQVQRQDFKDRMITIRADDVRAIACLFGVAPDALGERLDELGLRVTS